MVSSNWFQTQSALFALTVILASSEEEEKDEEAGCLPPISVQNAADTGIYLYKKYGGTKNLRLPQSLAEGSSITSKDLDEMLDFFEDAEIDKSKPGWNDKIYPSADWIRWLLMGGDAGCHWVRTTKELVSARAKSPK